MMVDSLLAQRFERDTITSTMKMGDGSFVGEDDLSVLLDDYVYAEAVLVNIDDLSSTVPLNAIDKLEDSVSWSGAVSALGYGVRLLIRSKPMPIIGVLAAAVVLLALWLINPFAGNEQLVAPGYDVVQSPPQKDHLTVATLTGERNAHWAERVSARGSSLTTGTQLHPGDRLTLTSGFAEITTNRGAIAIVEAPATIELTDNSNSLRLHAGKLVGICETESSKGFLVMTDTAHVVDVGTRFGVEVDAQRSATWVQVYEGEVRAAAVINQSVGDKPAVIGEFTRLLAQDAVVVSANATRQLEPVAFDANRFMRRSVEVPIAVANHSFELPELDVTPRGSVTRFRVATPGWTPSAEEVCGVFVPGTESYASASSGLGHLHEQQAFSFVGFDAASYVTQTLEETAQLGVTYRLTVAVGDRESNNRTKFGGYRIQLLSDGQVIASSEASTEQSPGDGTFTDVTLTYTVRDTDPLGPLGIRLMTQNLHSNNTTDFDNVRLTKTLGLAEAPRP